MHAVLSFIPLLVLVILAALVIVLGFGLITMGSDRFSPLFRNKVMRVRVALQGLLIVLILIMLASATFGGGGGT